MILITQGARPIQGKQAQPTPARGSPWSVSLACRTSSWNLRVSHPHFSHNPFSTPLSSCLSLFWSLSLVLLLYNFKFPLPTYLCWFPFFRFILPLSIFLLFPTLFPSLLSFFLPLSFHCFFSFFSDSLLFSCPFPLIPFVLPLSS